MKRTVSVILALIFIFTLSSCGLVGGGKGTEDIVILFTNDIHGGFDEGITLSSVSAYYKELKENYKYVELVDCGDAVQGSYLASVSHGKALVQLMNEVGYDFATFGNHEFDFGIEGLNNLITESNAHYLCCNITYSGSVEGLKNVKPYEIFTYGNRKVAYIGVSTPHTLTDASPSNFIENGEKVYSFCEDGTGKALAEKVQNTIDEIKKAGVDFVIVLSHLGIGEDSEPYTSTYLAENTSGIDVILDGHSHNEFTYYGKLNKDGEQVLIAQTGTKLESVGQLLLSHSGSCLVTTVSDLTRTDSEFDAKAEEILAPYNEQLEKEVCTSDFELSIYDRNGIRAVRNQETAIGNLCSDSIRYIADADIGFENGGGIRATIPKGVVKYSDIINATPFGNVIVTTEIKGSVLADYLEYTVKNALSETSDTQNGKPLGEEGSFPNMSGIRFTVDVTVPSSVEVDDDDQFLSVGETRRVSDIKILIDGEYQPIDLERTYTIAAPDHVLKDGGSGTLHLLQGYECVSTGYCDYEVLNKYITEYLKGDLSAYSVPEGRITFIGR